ncbi:MAG TPA: hypothetical protein VFA98_14760 [Thermoanaerobaculia bacterium]|nr:hypothetical protein [Thermoanaerobaculia bacterium]
MREERKRKALYVHRREDLYAPEILRKERSGAKKSARRAASKRPSGHPGRKTGR